jgi:dipeptidyl aminopeptidase/acylaminoacyl peptidase
MKKILFLSLFIMSEFLAAQDVPYQKPPQAILDLIDVELPPVVVIDREAQYMISLKRSGLKSLEELAETELRLAGLRINPTNHNASRTTYYIGLSIQTLEGKNVEIKGLPPQLRVEYMGFSPRQTYFSFVNVLKNIMELWVVEVKTGKAKKVSQSPLSALLGTPYTWSPDEKFIYAMVRSHPENYVEVKELPRGPSVQEATGSKAAARTFQDLLKNRQDEDKFDYFATTIPTKCYLDGREEKFLNPAIYKRFVVSPDGEYIITEEIHKPYSYQLPLNRFPYKVNLFDRAGKLVKTLVDKPLQDKIPTAFNSTEDGKRAFQWRNDKPSTLVWVEAQDGGDPTNDVPQRDKIFIMEKPFSTEGGTFIAATKSRYAGIVWGDDNTAILYDNWWKTRNEKAYLINPAQPNDNPKIIFDHSFEDLYADPGNFVTAPNAFNRNTILFSKDKKKVYLQGEGYSSEGNKPFLDEFDLNTYKTTRLWQAEGKNTYESIFRILDLDKKTMITRIESPKQFPNYFIRNWGKNDSPKQMTFNKNPYAAMENVTKQRIEYTREDGVKLNATLYLPPKYDLQNKTRLPLLLHAYPSEFKDEKAASQVKESPHQFVYLNWGSPIYWAMRGYAILDNADFPIIGKGNNEPNDTYLEQLVANARAAIKAVDDMGVVDPKRCGVMGHSYGGFMTANLLAHSDLFAAGIARSGAYNRTLTPFGFQAEERNYWQAKEVYDKMSPFNYADKIKSPLLLIHGEADNNPGTFTLQTERLFQAIKGLGGKSRMVLLPFESHGYAAKENILHMLWEMDSWMEKYVKNAVIRP